MTSVELSSSKSDEGSQPGEINLKTVGKKAVRRHADMIKIEKPGVNPGKLKNQRKSVQLEANYTVSTIPIILSANVSDLLRPVSD